MDFAVHRYRSACGRLDLAARLYPGAGPTLLLMHGLTRNSADFAPLAERLVGRYRMVVPDQRGRGLSQWDPETTNYRPDVYAHDMFALLESLGIARTAVIGTSMGGLIAMVMNAIRPDVVGPVIFNDVGPVLEAEGLTRIQGYVGPSQAMANWDEAAAHCRAINGAALPYLDEAGWHDFARRTCIEQADGTILFAYDPAIAQGVAGSAPSTVPPDLWPLWDMLDTKPALVIRGERSDLLARKTVDEMRGRHAGPFATAEVPQAGHAPILNEPVALDAIDRFLQEHVA